MGSEKAKRSRHEDPQGGEKKGGQGCSVVVIDEWRSRERSRELSMGRSGELSRGNREMGAQRGKHGKAAPRLTGVDLSRLTRREKQAVVLRGIFSEHTTDDQLDALVGVLVTAECV